MYAVNSIDCFFFFQAEDGIRDVAVTGVQTCALPICSRQRAQTSSTLVSRLPSTRICPSSNSAVAVTSSGSICLISAEWKSRSEEHTSELQSRLHLVCRLLLEKKKKKTTE